MCYEGSNVQKSDLRNISLSCLAWNGIYKDISWRHVSLRENVYDQCLKRINRRPWISELWEPFSAQLESFQRERKSEITVSFVRQHPTLKRYLQGGCGGRDTWLREMTVRLVFWSSVRLHVDSQGSETTAIQKAKAPSLAVLPQPQYSATTILQSSRLPIKCQNCLCV